MDWGLGPRTGDRGLAIVLGMLVRLLGSVALLAISIACRGEVRESPPRPSTPEFELNELSVAQLQDGMTSGRYTSRRLVELYLQRIAQIDGAGPTLRSVIETNPDALAIADALDAERKAKGPRGPLHGIPILIKDNIDTGDKMLTTAGSLALTGGPAPRDAFVVERLRAAGVVILGKTNLSEWANFRSAKSTSGWSARGGQVKNPYVLDRNPCGSSSGTGAAIAASLATVGVGTETDGSVVCPSAVSALVGIKPTIGLVSRTGIIPIAHSQDTAGPMARTVADAAALLNGMVGVDQRDAAMAAAPAAREDYTAALKADALKSARIGVPRAQYFGYSAPADAAVDAAIAVMKAQGATIVDPADIPTAARLDACEIEVLLYELKSDLNSYLATRGSAAAASTLKDLIAFNERERAREMPYFGQELFIRAEKQGPADLTRIPCRRDAVPAARARRRHRCGDDDAQAGCAGGADAGTGMADRPREWRSHHRRRVDSRSRRRLSEHHGASRLGRRAAGRGPLHGARVERIAPHQPRVRIRASQQAAQAAEVSADDSTGLSRGSGTRDFGIRDSGFGIRSPWTERG